jgi:hypothetical protein
VVPSNWFSSVGVVLFPEDLLCSVQTGIGGASASYDTDVVASGVNFILDTDYEWLKNHAQSACAVSACKPQADLLVFVSCSVATVGIATQFGIVQFNARVRCWLHCEVSRR